jgi:AraC family transcriptional regulator of adaptative response/methylated-DNA-[protein]-cysteine methyltransferase
LKEIESHPTARIRDANLRAWGIDPARARRYFRRNYGMTFQAYARARRLGSALDQIRQGAPLDDVALGNGYDSHSGFYDAFTRTFGKTPGQGTVTDCIQLTWLESPIGPLLAGATADGICMLEFTERRMLEAHFTTLRKCFRCALVPGVNEHLDRLNEELAEYFDGARRQFTGPLVYPGSPFQRLVWEELLRIPYGQTCSYEDIARRIGTPQAPRAVGRANGQNRIAILIPCHRVVNKCGKLGGYGGGLWRKQFLLEHEKSRLS